MSGPVLVSVRLLGGAAVLAFLAARLGAGPFVDGVRNLGGGALMAATAITLLSTVCCALRWRLVAAEFGLRLDMTTAVAAYYRSQFLNTTLPGGILGDVHRGVLHGRTTGQIGRGLRVVGWERTSGHAVQVAVSLAVLSLLPSPVQSMLPPLAVTGVAVALTVTALATGAVRHGRSWWSRLVRAALADVRTGLLPRRTWPGVVLTSIAALAGHVVIFLIAVQSAGIALAPSRSVPLALLVLLAMSVPVNIAGWGPREGVAAWSFGAAGLGMAEGVTVAVAYGVMVFVACLPGAVFWLVGRRHARTVMPAAERPLRRSREGASHG